jgi:hypothetical protein
MFFLYKIADSFLLCTEYIFCPQLTQYKNKGKNAECLLRGCKIQREAI